MIKLSNDTSREISQIEKYFKAYIDHYISTSTDSEVSQAAIQLISDSVLYSLNAGGKRIRPILLMELCLAYGGNINHAIKFAVALEMIHTYSLIHDDLPCMDDDDLRRGKPTNHVVYGEDIATLAGDALLNMASEIMLDACIESTDNTQLLYAMREILKGSGASGMILGQVADIKYHELDTMKNIDKAMKSLDFINENKTGKLLTAAIVSGAYLGHASQDEIEKLREIGKDIGYLFQIVDDVLDVVGDVDKIGKRTQIDEKNHKLTYPTLLGLENTKDAIQQLKMQLIDQIDQLQIEKDFLKGLVQFLAERDY